MFAVVAVVAFVMTIVVNAMVGIVVSQFVTTTLARIIFFFINLDLFVFYVASFE